MDEMLFFTLYSFLLIMFPFVPANHTGNLQPMDLSVNFLFKSNLSTAFNNWLTKQILLQLQKKVALKDITINDSMMVLKVCFLQLIS